MKKLTYLLMAISVICMASCRDKKVKTDNPFLAGWDTPFGMPPFGDIRPEHFKPAFEEAMRVNNEEIDAIINNAEAPTFDNVILALDNSGQMLQRVNSIFGMINSADSNDEIQAIEVEMSPLLTAHGDNISLNPQLFNKIKAVYDMRESLNLDPMQTRLLEKKYKDFVRSGANLSDPDKEILKRINNELADADVKFRTNLLAEMKNFLMVVESADLGGLPSDVRDAAAKLAEERGEKVSTLSISTKRACFRS